jgi:hypothetical protein
MTRHTNKQTNKSVFWTHDYHLLQEIILNICSAKFTLFQAHESLYNLPVRSPFVLFLSFQVHLLVPVFYINNNH